MTANKIDAIPADKLGTIAAGGYQCRAATDCTATAYCVANAVFKGACPPSDWVNDPSTLTLNTTVSDIIPSCADNAHATACYEFHKSSHTTCNSGSSLCAYDGCTRSICSQWEGTDVSGQIPSASFVTAWQANQSTVQSCLLTNAQLTDHFELQCVVACEFQSGVCASTALYASTPHGLNQSVQSVFRAPGRTCDDFNGYCTADGVCQAATADNPINALSQLNAAWFDTNWPIIVGSIGGFLVVALIMKFLYRKQKQQIDSVFKRLGTKIGRTMQRIAGAKKGKAAISAPVNKVPAAAREDNLKRLRNLKASTLKAN